MPGKYFKKKGNKRSGGGPRVPFTMKGYTYPGTAPTRLVNPDDLVVQEATGPGGGGGGIVKSAQMVKLEKIKPSKDSPDYKKWTEAYMAAQDRLKEQKGLQKKIGKDPKPSQY